MDTTINTMMVNILLYITPILAGLLAKYLLNKIGTEKVNKIQAELATKTELTAAAVTFAEQAYKDLDGAGKYEKALAWLADQAKKVGLKITVDEAKGLIESAVLAMKKAIAQ
jgi:Phage holin protein (Holin_LLH).